jgi:cyclin L
VVIAFNVSMAHFANPLVSPEQLTSSTRINDAVPQSTQDVIRFSTSRLTQAAGILLRLPQSVTAQAVVVLYRYWTVEELARNEFGVTSPNSAN